MLGKRLIFLRGDKTQKEVAEIFGVSRARYAHYEQCRSKPGLDLLQRMANYYGVSVDFLLGRNDNDVPAGIYLRLAKDAEEMQLSEKDVQLISEMFKRFKKSNE